MSFWSTILVIILTTLVAMLFGSEKSTIPWKTRFLSAPDNLWMAAKSAWVSRERGLAVFAGVFLASLVATWLLAVMWPNGQVLASMLAELGESIREFVVVKYNTLVLFLFSKSSSQLSDVAHKTESEAEVQQSISQSGTKK